MSYLRRLERPGPAMLTAAVALVIGLVLTLAAMQATQASLRAEAQAHFEGDLEVLHADIERRIGQAAYGLKGARAAYAAYGNMTRRQFQAYVEARHMASEFPGIRGFGFIQRVPREELDAFVAAQQRDDAPEFAVRTSGNEPDLYVIKYIEPLASNRPAQGYDIGSEPLRRAAAQRAVDTGETSLTGSVTVVQDEQKGAGWLIFVPVYRAGADPRTPQERRQALVGLAYAPLVAAEVLGSSKRAVEAELDFRLFDGDPAQGHLLFDTEERVNPMMPVVDPDRYARRMFQATVPLLIGGRTLTVHAASSPKLEASVNTGLVTLVGIGGGALSVLLALSAWLLVIGRQRAQAMAQSMTADLDRMARVLERTSNAVFGTDRDLRIIWVNEGFTRLTGYTPAEAVGKTPTELIGHPRADPAARARLEKAARTGENCRVEILNRRKDGTAYWVETEIQPSRDDKGEITGSMEIALDITERKQAEQRLRASEAFLEQAERLADVGGWELDLETGQLKISQQMTRIFELSPSAQPGVDDFLGFFSGPARDLITANTQECVKSGSPWDLELPMVTARGHTRWVRTVGQVERQGERSVRLIGILQDVTERRTMEDELRLSNARMQGILDNLPCGLSVFDGQLRLVAHNSGFRSLLGFPDELFARPVVQFEELIRFNAERGEYGSGDVDALVSDIVRRACEPTEHRFERARPNGTQLEVRGAPMPGGGFVTTYVDITDRKRAEEAVRASEHLMRVVTDNIPGRVAYWDRDLLCRFANRVYCELFGRTREQMLMHPAAEVFGQARLDRLQPYFDRALAGELVSFELQELDPAGQPITLLAHYIPDVQDGQVAGFFALAFDVTEIRQARDMALQASMAKSQFLANMSHEIRTPMNAILGMLTLLHNTELSARQLDYVTKTEGAARSLLGLLNDILDFSKVEAGKMTLDPRPFSVDTLLRDLSVILSANAGTKNVELLFDLDTAVPPMLVGDDMRLRQILINLGGNALKFTDQGEVVVGVRLLARQDDQVTLEISVRDTGIGIAPEHQAQIFEGFMQAEATTTRRFGGTGLGLAICQRLVRMMGSELRVESEQGRGSRFAFTLVLPVATQPAPAHAASADAPLRVLFVDDNPSARLVLAAQAASLGWTVDAVDSGQEATRRLQDGSHHYDVVFVDWRMPGLDGWETSLRIRELPEGRRTPLVVMVTAHGREMLASRSADERARLDAFLVKPVTASMLLDAVIEARRQREPSPAPAPAPAAPSRLAARPLAGLRLLVVEDNRNNQQVAQELLQAQGAVVDLASDGREGVARVAAANPAYDAVLMDVQMPVMDGFTATREIRQTLGRTTLPIIAMTANAMSSDREDCLFAGMNDHVGKPFHLAELVATILRHVGAPQGAGVGVGSAAVPAVPAVPAAPPAATSAGGIELGAALERLGGDVDLYRELVPSFRDDGRSMLDKMDGLLAGGQRQEAQRIMHTLKGLGGTMGATALAAQAAAAEKVLKQPPSDADAPAVAATRAAFAQALSDLDAALAKLGSEAGQGQA